MRSQTGTGAAPAAAVGVTVTVAVSPKGKSVSTTTVALGVAAVTGPHISTATALGPHPTARCVNFGQPACMLAVQQP